MSKTLLLADDSITIQKVVGITFANEDYEIVSVDNGEEAVNRAATLKPDIILADVVMPKMDGYEVCEKIKTNENLRHIPVLLLTGAFKVFDEEKSKKVGADGHIAKPFDSQALIDKVNELASRAATKIPVAGTPPPPVSPVPPVRPTPPVSESAPFAPNRPPPEAFPPLPTPEPNPFDAPPSRSDFGGRFPSLPDQPTAFEPPPPMASPPSPFAPIPESADPFSTPSERGLPPTPIRSPEEFSFSDVGIGSEPASPPTATPTESQFPSSFPSSSSLADLTQSVPTSQPFADLGDQSSDTPSPMELSMFEGLPTPTPQETAPPPEAKPEDNAPEDIWAVPGTPSAREGFGTSPPPTPAARSENKTPSPFPPLRTAVPPAPIHKPEPAGPTPAPFPAFPEPEEAASEPPPWSAPPAPEPAPVSLAQTQLPPPSPQPSQALGDLQGMPREVIEKIAWEIIPDLAETIIREEIERLKKEKGVFT